MIWYTTSQVSSSHLSLIFLFPFQASTFTSTRSPGFKFTAPIFLLYYHFCQHASVVDWACASHRALLNLSLTEAMLCTHPHSWHRPLSWGLIAGNGGEDKVDWEPRPSSKHQIMWTVPGNCGLGGIVGMCYFSQMRWPVSFLFFSQLPNHVHNHLVPSLYQPISLGVVGHGLQSLNAKDLAQFLNNATCEASTSVT